MNDHDQPLADARLRGASAFQCSNWKALAPRSRASASGWS